MRFRFVGAGLAVLGLMWAASPVAAEERPTTELASQVLADGVLRQAVLDADRNERLRVIVPASEVEHLRRLGFDVGDQVGTLPFFSASATRAEIVNAARAGMSEGMSLDQFVPAPEPVAIPEWMRSMLVNASQVTGASVLHEEGLRGEGQSIAIIDSGIQASHPYFRDASGRSRIVAESCFVSKDIFPNVDLPCPGGQNTATGPGAADIGSDMRFFHGTHVAGIAAGDAAQAAEAEGFTGIAPAANLVVSRVFGWAGAAESDIVAALDWVATNAATYNIASVNLSLGSFQSRYIDCAAVADSAYGAVTSKLASAGVAVVAASGNAGALSVIGSPACATGWVSVGATDERNRVAVFSNVGPDLDILAPGMLLWSSMPGDKFDAQAGTSMASPVVAGAFALLRQAVPAASPDTVLASMRATGPRLDDVIVKNLPTLRVDMTYNQLSGTSRSAPTVPEPPTNVKVTAGNGSLQVTWNPPANDGGSPITDYIVVTPAKSMPMDHMCPQPTKGTSCTIHGLTNGASYVVTVMARNAFGASRPSQPSAATTPSANQPDKPRAVRDLKAKALKGAIRITWQPPAGVSDVASLTYQYQVGRAAWKPTSERVVTVKGQKGTRITVKVRAITPAGPGPERTVSGVPK